MLFSCYQSGLPKKKLFSYYPDFIDLSPINLTLKKYRVKLVLSVTFSFCNHRIPVTRDGIKYKLLLLSTLHPALLLQRKTTHQWMHFMYQCSEQERKNEGYHQQQTCPHLLALAVIVGPGDVDRTKRRYQC